MPGLHTIIRNSNNISLKESDFSFTRHRENFKIKILSQNSYYCTAISFHDGFPFQEWEHGEIHIVLEGMIYNRSDDDIQMYLKEIAEHFVRENGYKELVKKFVESSDGEYTVQILHKTTNRFLFFNDYLGQFSWYYYCKDGVCVCSTEIKTVLNFIPKIRINKSALLEFLMYQYPLGNKTIFYDIFHSQPSQLMVIKKNGENLSFEVTNSADLNFILTNPFKDEKESIEVLKDAFLEAVHNRVTSLENHGYGIIADLSGGFDTRAVLAGLSKFSKNVDYFTQEYVRDESPNAKGIFQQLGAPGDYHKCSFKNVLDETTISELVYMTDGMVDYETTSICFQDMEYVKKNWPKKSGQICGYAGEFIRHPFQYISDSLLSVCDSPLYSALSIDLACKILNSNPHDYKKELSSYFDTFPEKTPVDQLRRFYYEYIIKSLTGIYCRERIHSWTISPFMSAAFLRAVFSRIPLQWAGYKYFIKFMYEVDPRTIKYPIYARVINLESQFSITVYDIRNKLNNIITRTHSLSSLYNFIYKKENTKNSKQLLERFRFYYNSVSFSSIVFNYDVIELNLFKNEGDTKRLLTLLMYFKELEDRFKEKIVW